MVVEIFDNIRKIYRFQRPIEELADYVEFFSESSAEATEQHFTGLPFTVKLFPSWTPTCWINLGCPYQLINGTNVHEIKSNDDVLILRDSIVERRNMPNDHIFTIKFYAGGLESILGIPQAGFTKQVIDLKTILPVHLLTDIKAANSFDDRVKLIEHFLLINSTIKKRINHSIKVIKDTITTFEHSGFSLTNDAIASKCFMTSKTVNRYFHNVVGSSPKNYFSALKTRTTLHAYLSDRKAFVAEDFGYYDMSHFYKDVIKFTGQSLSAQSTGTS